MQSKHFSFLFVALTFLLLGTTEVSSSGERTFGEACNPRASSTDDQSTHCDTSKRLSCHMNSRTCTCHHEDRDVYNKAEDRCETKFGKFCSASDTFPTICEENTACDPLTNFCNCKHGATKKEVGSGCIKEDNGGENGAPSNGIQQPLVYASIVVLTIGTQLWA